VESVDAHEPMGIADAEAFAQRILATIDEHQASAVVDPDRHDPDRHDADRARVAADLEGLRRAQRHPGRGLEETDLHRLRATFSDGLIRTGAGYGVRP